ncbi:MAG TPA: hypothetical protein VLZ76_09805 [Lysobacter sp.]|jgi:hypothetical protein|nr:hypothetical protein [Lysobacter sp.]
MKRSIVSIGARQNHAAIAPVSAVTSVAGQAALANAPQAQYEPRRRSSQQAAGCYTSGSTYLNRSRRGGFGSRSSMFRIS